jgi:hypothetical protein
LRNALLDTLDWAYEEHWFERLGEDEDVLIFRDPSMQQKWEAMTTTERANWLCGQLWNCSDILPGSTGEEFGLNQSGETYARLVRILKPLIPTVSGSDA